MSAGDFASVPPGTIHRYQIMGAHSEFVGLIVPGGWGEFFRFIGEPYSGPMWPMDDDRNVFEMLIPKLKQAAEQFDMVPCTQHKQFDPQDWEASDNALPEKPEPYFLQNVSGPARRLAALFVVLMSPQQSQTASSTSGASKGRHTITSIAYSQNLNNAYGSMQCIMRSRSLRAASSSSSTHLRLPGLLREM